MVDCNGRSGLSLLIESALIEQNVDEYASIFFTFSQIKQFATQKQFRKFNRQYLKNQQTVLSSPDSPCQTVLKFPKIHARQFWIFSAFYSPLDRSVHGSYNSWGTVSPISGSLHINILFPNNETQDITFLITKHRIQPWGLAEWQTHTLKKICDRKKRGEEGKWRRGRVQGSD